jgi:addiction module RelE/StbE family toxin
MRLRYTPRALRQFSSIAAYIAKDDPDAALRVGRRIQTICDLLAKSPGIGRSGVLGGTRELTVGGLPYVIVYRIEPDQVAIMGIYHHRQRRPGQSQS